MGEIIDELDFRAINREAEIKEKNERDKWMLIALQGETAKLLYTLPKLINTVLLNPKEYPKFDDFLPDELRTAKKEAEKERSNALTPEQRRIKSEAEAAAFQSYVSAYNANLKQKESPLHKKKH